MKKKINIIVPNSNVSNNIYSFSEVIYMVGYLKKNSILTQIHVADIDYLQQNQNKLSNKENVLVLMWDGEELIEWLNAYEYYVGAKKTIIFGLTAQLYGVNLMSSYKSVTNCILSYSYKAVCDAIKEKETLEYASASIDELSHFSNEIDFLQQLPIIPIVSSRGCMNNCNFCATSIMGQVHNEKYQYRDSEDLYKEILWHVKSGHTSFYFVDSCFVSFDHEHQKNIVDLCNKIIDSSLNISFYIETRVDTIDLDLFALLKRAGLKRVLLGVENVSVSVLKRYNKQIDRAKILKAISILRELGINMDVTMIMFDPFTTIDEIKENIKFVLEHDLLEYIGLKGLFRRLILVPNNRVVGKEDKLNYISKDGMPTWINNSMYYKIIDPKIQMLEQSINNEVDNWINVQNEQVKKITNIREKNKMRKLSSKMFVEIIDETLNDFESIKTTDDFLNYFNLQRSKEWYGKM